MTAIISPCGLYRYQLSRTWDRALIDVAWVMLNPSTADAEKDDPTIRRCISFSKRLGYGGLYVANLFALRSPNPQDLIDSSEAGIDPVGPENDQHIREIVDRCAIVIAAWGAHPVAESRAKAVQEIVHGLQQSKPIYCLGKTSGGAPRHPLYVKGDTELIEWRKR